RRSVSAAASACKVCSFFRSELADGEEPAALDVLVPLGDPVSVKVGFFTLVALRGIPSRPGRISPTSTMGTGPLDASGASARFKKSPAGARGPLGDRGEARSRYCGFGGRAEEAPLGKTAPFTCARVH